MTRLEPWGFLFDYYTLATCLLAGAGVASIRLRQPARRLAVARASLGGLAVLLVLVALPTWPKARLAAPLGRTNPATAPTTVRGPGGAEMMPPVVLLDPAVGGARATTEAKPAQDAAGPARHGVISPGSAPRPRANLDGWEPAAWAFATGAATMLAWLVLGSWRAAMVRRRAGPAPAGLVAALARVVGPGRAVPELLVSALIRQPVAIGAWRPAIILPEVLVRTESAAHLKAALAHEWAHIRHGDLRLIALSRLLLPVLYAHPAYWWLRRQVRNDQEALADAAAASGTGRISYAEVLLAWSGRYVGPPPILAGGAVALFERPSQIRWRIGLLLDRNFRVEPACPRWWRLAVRAAATVAVLGLSLLSLRPGLAVNAAPQQPQAPASRSQTETRPMANLAESVQLLDPEGKPFAGAQIYQSGSSFDRGRVESADRLIGTTDRDGSCAVPDTPNAPSRPWTLVLTAEGFGSAFLDPKALPGSKTIRLVRDDVPIRGRVLDIQGRPVVGAKIQVVGVLWHPSGRLDPWIAKLQAEKQAFPVQYGTLQSWSSDTNPFYPAVESDKDGRFTIRGVGRERIASLLIHGPGIETRFEYVATRLMPTIKMPDFGTSNASREIVYHSAEFDLVAGLGAEVGGTVRDQDTGQPLAGVRVQTTALFGNPLRTLNTTTDAQGRYRLTGIPPKTDFNDNQDLLALVEDGPAYLPTIRPLGQVDVVKPTTVDLMLKRGVRVRGRVVDKATGKGVRAKLDYYILRDNPSLRTYPRYGTIRAGFPYPTADDGSFTLAVMPGRGVIGARAGNEPYRMGVGSEALKGLRKEAGQADMVDAEPSDLMPANYHTLVVIDPQPGDESFACEIALDRGKRVKATVVGPDGAPLAGVRVEGLLDWFRTWSHEPLGSAEFTVEGIGTGAIRELNVRHEAKGLAGSIVIQPDDLGPIAIRLEPSGTVTGRLLDTGGLPLANSELTCLSPFGEQSAGFGSLREPVKTDGEGRFRAEGLIPGRKHRFWSWSKGPGSQGRYHNVVGMEAIVVAGGATKDLGDVALAKD